MLHGSVSKAVDGFFHTGFQLIFKAHIAQVEIVFHNMYSAFIASVAKRYKAKTFNKILRARHQFIFIVNQQNSLAGVFGKGFHLGRIEGKLLCPFNRQGKGMRRGKLTAVKAFQQLILACLTKGIHRVQPQFAGGKGACFVEHQSLHLGQQIEVDTALKDDPLAGSPAQSNVITKRNRDHQCAGTGHDEQHQSPFEPYCRGIAKKGRYGKDQQCCSYHSRGVIARKAGDKAFGVAFFGSSAFDQFADPAEHAFRIGFLHGDLQHAFTVHKSGKDLGSGFNRYRNRFAGQR